MRALILAMCCRSFGNFFDIDFATWNINVYFGTCIICVNGSCRWFHKILYHKKPRLTRDVLALVLTQFKSKRLNRMSHLSQFVIHGFIVTVPQINTFTKGKPVFDSVHFLELSLLQDYCLTSVKKPSTFSKKSSQDESDLRRLDYFGLQKFK